MTRFSKVAGLKRIFTLCNRLGREGNNFQKEISDSATGRAGGIAGETAAVVTRPGERTGRRASLARAGQAIRYQVRCALLVMLCCPRCAIDATVDAVDRCGRAVVARAGVQTVSRGRGGSVSSGYQILLMGSLNADIGAKAAYL